MAIVIGVDPGPEDFHWVAVDGVTVMDHGSGGLTSTTDLVVACRDWDCKAVVIERPETFGAYKIKHEPLLRTSEMFGRLVAMLRVDGARVSGPGRMPILRQVGWTPGDKQSRGGADRWLRGHIEQVYQQPIVPHLRTTHYRAAYAAALFAWNDPRNRRYLIA